MRRRLVLISVIVALLVLIVPAALMYYVAYTESGLQFVVSKVPRRVGRASLQIDAVRGTLAHGFEIGRLEIDHERSHLRFDGIRGRLALAPLFLQTLHAKDVTIEDAYIEVRRRTRPAQKYTPRFLPPGLTIRSDRLRAERVTLVTTTGRRFDATELQTSGFVRHRTIRILDAGFQMEAMRITGRGELRAADPMELSADARIDVQMEGQPRWVIAASGEGDLNALDLNAHFTAPFRADFTGQARELTRNWNWSGKANVVDFSLQAWGGGETLGRITGELELHGDASGFTARGPVTPAGLRAGPFDLLFEGSYASRVVTASRIELTHGSSNAHVTGSGTIGIGQGGPQLDLRGNWKRFRWPLVGKTVPVRSNGGEYTLSGTWPYELRARGDALVRDLDPIPFEIFGHLARNQLTIQEGEVSAFDGQARFTGEVAWSPQDRWAVRGKATGLNPERIRSGFPGQLNFAFDASGEGFGGDADFAVDIRDIGGRLRGVRSSGGGKIARRKGAWEFHQVNVRLGRTKLAANGRIAREFDLTFEIDADSLRLLRRGSQGQLHATGTLRGTARNPVIQATARGGNIRHEGIGIGSFSAEIDFDSTANRESKIDVQARDVSFGERRASSVALTLDGTAAEHVLRLTGKASNLALDARAAGAFMQGVWRGQISRLDVNGSESLHLELDSPFGVLASAERVNVEWFCLRGMPARLCADADWNPKDWSTTVTATELPMSTLTSGLKRDVEYRGTLGITARAFGEGGGPVQGNLRAELVDARLAQRLAGGRVQRITLGSGLVTANATLDAIKAEVSLDAGQIGTVKGRLDVARTAPGWQDMPISGTLNAQTAELGFLTIYVPEIDRAAGRLDADLEFAGTLGMPLVNGTLRLSQAELDLYQINLSMRQASLEARLLENGLNFSGSARIGAGDVQTDGRIEWRDGLPFGKFALNGQNLRVVDIPEAQIDASPKLDFRIEGRRIEVTGAVAVPYAKIAPNETVGAVRASSDEIIVGEETKDPSKRFDVATGITLSLGDRVSIETSGLTGRLTGSITVRSGREELTTATGELSIEEGDYTAYGRKLEIQRGRLIFTGGAVANPGVDIRAVKKYPDVTAGINVRGTLLQPRLTFFSEPSLPQSQIVSLILAGGGLASAQNGQNQSHAGNELLAQGGAILAQQLGARVGLEDVSLESDIDNPDETSLVLGKYLSPRLYVSYGISFTESLNTLKLRYTLSDRWTIRTEVGEARGADLVYTLKK